MNVNVNVNVCEKVHWVGGCIEWVAVSLFLLGGCIEWVGALSGWLSLSLSLGWVH